MIHSPFQYARQRVTARTACLNFAAYDHSYGSFPPGPCPKVKARLGRTKQIWNLTHAAPYLRYFCRQPTHADPFVGVASLFDGAPFDTPLDTLYAAPADRIALRVND